MRNKIMSKDTPQSQQARSHRTFRENHEVSVVILTKNSALTLENCLRSVMEEGPGEILAVDGFSTDGTLDILRRFGVKIISDASRSMGYLRNLGINAAKETYIMFVDSDAVLSPACMATLRRELDDHGWAGINARILSGENVSYWQKAEDAVYAGSRYEGETDHLDSLDHVYLFRSEILRRFQFDPYFVESAEDRALCQCLADNKLQVGVSSAVAFHHHRREFSSFVRHRFGYGLGHARFSVKHGAIRTFIEPLTVAYSEVLHGMAEGSARLIPYWLVRGISEFLGVLVGLSRARSEIRRNQQEAYHGGQPSTEGMLRRRSLSAVLTICLKRGPSSSLAT